MIRVGVMAVLAMGMTAPAVAPVSPIRTIDPAERCTLPEGNETGAYSACAISLVDAFDFAGAPGFTGVKPIALASPDRASTASIGKDGYLRLSGALGAASHYVMLGPNAAMAWAPDSRGLFVTINDGGIVGSYELSVFVPVQGRLVRRDLTRLIHRIYRQPGKCYEPETPNVAGVAWLGSHRRLLVAGETLYHSNCDSMGNFTAYVVDPVTMQVIETIDQIEAKRRWAHLMGPELMGADDGCVRDRTSCMIPDLHPELFDADGELKRG